MNPSRLLQSKPSLLSILTTGIALSPFFFVKGTTGLLFIASNCRLPFGSHKINGKSPYRPIFSYLFPFNESPSSRFFAMDPYVSPSFPFRNLYLSLPLFEIPRFPILLPQVSLYWERGENTALGFPKDWLPSDCREIVRALVWNNAVVCKKNSLNVPSLKDNWADVPLKGDY